MADLPVDLGLDGNVGEPVTGGKVSAVWRATLDGAPVAVRRTPWFRRLEEVEYEVGVLRALHHAGAPVAAPLADPVRRDDGVWTVFEWIDGASPTTPVDPARYGALLAELHAHTDALVGLGQRPRWARHDQFLTAPRGDGARCLADVIDEFAAATGQHRLVSLVVATHERLAAAPLDDLPRTIAHGDFGPHQVIEQPDGRLVVIDWDFCHLDLRATDLALGASLARPSIARAAAYVGGYGRLEPEEVALLADLRRAFHCTNLANQVVALWAHGIDISGPLAVIDERMEREQWWGPTMVAGGLGHVADDEVAASSTDLEVAHVLADRAALVAMHFYEAGVVAETKADSSPVTDADTAVELLLRHSLAELRPDDAILGEELGTTGTSNRTWILDPIDGTSFFSRREPHWRVQIALEIDGEIVVALVDAPALGVRWWATAGGGAFERLDGVERRLAVSARSELDGAVVAPHPAAIAGRLPDAVVHGSSRWALPLIELVRGEVDGFYVECCQVWDHAPWVLLVEEAGGRFTDHEGGRSPAKRGGLYSNAGVHDALLAAIAGG